MYLLFGKKLKCSDPIFIFTYLTMKMNTAFDISFSKTAWIPNKNSF